MLRITLNIFISCLIVFAHFASAGIRYLPANGESYPILTITMSEPIVTDLSISRPDFSLPVDNSTRDTWLLEGEQTAECVVDTLAPLFGRVVYLSLVMPSKLIDTSQTSRKPLDHDVPLLLSFRQHNINMPCHKNIVYISLPPVSELGNQWGTVLEKRVGCCEGYVRVNQFVVLHPNEVSYPFTIISPDPERAEQTLMNLYQEVPMANR
ncbi:hypothetical protein [Veronia pacifica]|uniref:Uncharacterized protein n=1 Tax=Veronia pacifica TaxID=1080227 RepID=A0A1C3EIE5_9GAMM|nr:hypothetical protein [Veronia pacifica]ODA33004.1 hypothetical protein A8L45_11980 [Veronia pacifica]